MDKTFEYLVPDYYADFSCKMGRCRSACCVGWPVSITMDDYFRLLGVECSPDLRSRLDIALHISNDPHPEAYAQITPRYDGECRLRMDDGRCLLQAELGEEALSKELSLDVKTVMEHYKPIPDTEEQFKLTERLCLEAGIRAVTRHAGALRHIYTPSGRKTVAEGKDLTEVKYIIGTGGALTRLPHREQLLRAIADCNSAKMMLFPKPGELELLFDDDYIMASLGVLSRRYPEAAFKLMQHSLSLA